MKRNVALSYRREGYEALLALFDSVKEGITIDALCAHALEIVQQVTGFDTVVVRVYDSRDHCHHLVAQEGLTAEMVKEVECLPMDVGFCGDAMKMGQPIFTSDIPSDPRSISPSTHKEGFKSLASVPLMANGNLVGTMELISKQRYKWDKEELSWLALMGRSIGSLISYIQLVERCKNLAVLEERSRLAQEIHDGSIQLLGALHFWTEAAQSALNDRDENAIRAAVDHIDSIANDAYGGLRDEILGLRVSVGEAQDITALVKDYLDRFHRQWGLETRLYIQRLDNRTDPLYLDLSSEVQLLRVIQEGLTNVRRHANASEVVLNIEEDTRSLKLVIQDNGQGFDSEGVAPDRLGLRIMQERVHSVGGEIRITSELGRGTVVEAVFRKHGKA